MKNSATKRFFSTNAYSTAAWAVLAVLVVVCAVRAPYLFSASGLGGLVVSTTPLILLVMGLTITALVGSGVDLAAGPLMIFVNVMVVTVLFDNRIGAAYIVIPFALGVGIAVQLIFALVITIARIEPIIVTLAGFLALAGINLVVMPDPGGQAPGWLAAWGAGRSPFSAMMLMLVICVALWIVLSRTPLFTRIRLVGANPRTAFVSGLPLTGTRILAHAISGALIGAAGLAYTGQIASGNPTQGATYTLAGITALVLGGISLAGGRGGILGAIPGAIAISLITFTLSTFSLGLYASFIVQLSYGLILILALLLSVVVPSIIRRRKESRNS